MILGNITTVFFFPLQAKKFKKIVKEGYNKAPKAVELDKILYLIKHGLKFQPGDRPNASEIFILLFELDFLKNINTKMTGERIWEEKGNLLFLFDFEPIQTR